ncbi:two-component system response regulator [Alishewanella sp. SMS8]|uniref:response regulator n=1 Tax=Alishewanella sp. SMS8 TaxID=2994676 RepID=UPI002740666B|nr:HD domain-containing phosphohydrolase [Alishewanella sp. SMS8]MDP5034606.1 response regulator [Alishewanella sp.]MDP5185717.1 response regulator [Alishewanella sp.]MDP5207771.1 response regulator [Alishewanella sp. SMS9]MDP5458093.1 response regulator [Alishewanella sp. SMS8]
MLNEHSAPAFSRILIVDDEPLNLRVLKQILQDSYKLMFATSAQQAFELLQHDKPDLILLDVMMPDITGFELCANLKARSDLADIPVIFVTALKDEIDESNGLELGAVDYITKPVSPAIVRARVKTHLSLVKVDELKRTRLQVVERLGRAAEYKDNETGLHVKRMSHYAQILALAAGYSTEWAEELLHAAPMHDIGKIGTPDHILLKPGKLTEDEMVIMRQHTCIGADILGECDSSLMATASQVARWHHEKWDGSGYPDGLAGAEIPIAARIVALADVFDALTSERPYKQAWTVDAALAFITSQSGKHFDPQLVPLLIDNLPKLLAIKAKWADRLNQ